MPGYRFLSAYPFLSGYWFLSAYPFLSGYWFLSAYPFLSAFFNVIQITSLQCAPVNGGKGLRNVRAVVIGMKLDAVCVKEQSSLTASVAFLFPSGGPYHHDQQVKNLH